LGQVEGRNAASGAEWLSAQPAYWRERVRHVAIDLCSTFRAAVHRALPHAAGSWTAFISCNSPSATSPTCAAVSPGSSTAAGPARATASTPSAKSRAANKEDLTEDQHILLTVELDHMGTYGRQIHAAWKAKELLRDLLGLAVSRTHLTPDHSAISAARHRFHAHIADHARLPELVTLAETVEQ
jgi:transposase